MIWLSKLCGVPPVVYLPTNFCAGKTDEELIDTLKNVPISPKSGNMIVAELLERLVKKKDP